MKPAKAFDLTAHPELLVALPNAAKTERPALTVESLGNWEEQMNMATPTEWVVEGVIADGAVHLITGESGDGKTSLMTAMGYAVSLGKPFAGHETTQRSVLVLDKDNPTTPARDRCRRLGVRYHPGYIQWGAWSPEEPPAPGGAAILEWVIGSQPKPLIVVHSSVSFHPGDENDAALTRQYMTQYAGLAKLGATVLLEHQSGKADSARDYRGSSDYKGACDIAWHVSNAGRESGRLTVLTLRAFKQRLGLPRTTVQLIYNEGTFSTCDEPKFKTISERLEDLLNQNPNVSKGIFTDLAVAQGIAQKDVLAWRERGIREGRLTISRSAHNKQSLTRRTQSELPT